jgi:pyruvate dehydrogenase E1 component beta subunit
VIDLRTLFPLDEETILESVKKTGRLLIVDEDTPICSMASHIAALVADKGFNYLDAPIKRINAPHTHDPFAPVLERMFVPESEKIVKVVKDELVS